MEDVIEITGARVHNLKNIHLDIPRDQLVVITGLSGSGKSSLAFDTLYAEGQRRYIETFSSYARQFLGELERPDVDKISGLSPVISIEQKTISKNPRSTVGTITEVYDFLRLLFARASEAYSYVTGEKMVRYTDAQILELIFKETRKQEMVLLAPLIRGRKGHYRELFQQIVRQGYLRARVDGEILEIPRKYQLDRYKLHDIEVVVDQFTVSSSSKDRLKSSLGNALKLGKGMVAVLAGGKIKHYSRHLMCPTSGLSYSEPEPNLFSFNSPYGACPDCNGLGKVSEIDRKKIIPNSKISIRKGGIKPLGEFKNNSIFRQIEALLNKNGLALEDPIEKLPEEVLNKVLFGTDEYLKLANHSGLNEYAMEYEGIINFINRQAAENPSRATQKWTQQFMNKIPCATCHGSRLKKEALYFKIDGKNIADLNEMSIQALKEWFSTIEKRLSNNQNIIAKELLKEIRNRIDFLIDVGLKYLSLGRPSRSLSGGEAQRIRLATQIGSQLVGVLYILDEPSIGLHPRDNQKLIEALKQLRDSGNSVIVVEHDKEMILSSDYIVDIGPGAGVHGGKIVAKGMPKDLKKNKSLTSAYLFGEKDIPIPSERRSGNGNTLKLIGAKGHNLKDVTAEFPLGKFICVTGVSGSGKSSLVNQTLYPLLNNHYFRGNKQSLPHEKIEGLKFLDKVIEIDQSPIGRTPRSNPATYTGVFSEIRNLFAQIPESKIRGYKAGRFSFNTAGGRCETCKGAGVRTIEMNFLPDVYVVCETCDGKRYSRETLEVRYKGKSISDVLDMTIHQASDFFEHIPKIKQHIQTLQDVGLGYLTLGQQSTTLSGGEAQRVKLASELSKKDTSKTFYILDEPTTGLHFEDIRMLINVLNRLVDNGNTVLVIEHNLDIIKVADHIIDLGPEGGENGGHIVCTGTPEEVSKKDESHTGKYLAQELIQQ